MRKFEHNLPKRSPQHISESESLKLLRDKLPAAWVVRDITERDYGIDVLIEITRKGRMTGSVIAAQIKARRSIKFSDKGEHVFRGIRASTYNYLLRLPAPSYLFICTLDDRKVYWASLRQHDRERKSPTKGAPNIRMHRGCDLSEVGSLSLLLSVTREQRWPEVERAIVGALMLFNNLGPLFLACCREDANKDAPSTVQYLLIQHYEFNQLIQRYAIAAKSSNKRRWPPLPELYTEALQRGLIGKNGTFKLSFVVEVFRRFISEYYIAIATCFEHVVNAPYWFEHYPYLILHLRVYPPLFVMEDWFARFFYDEYENETQYVTLDLFSDISSATYSDLSPR